MTNVTVEVVSGVTVETIEENITVNVNATPATIEIGTSGPQGPTGATGPAGPSNTLAIGTVVSGATAAATITGTSPSQTLNLTLPKGDTGPTGAGGALGYWANLSSNTTQASATSGQIVQLATISGNGFTLASNTITCTYAGTFSIEFAAQLYQVANGNPTVTFWIKKNGTDVPNSAFQWDLSNQNHYAVPNFTYSATFAANDQIQFFWTSTSSTTLQATPASTSPAYPAVPSVTVNIAQIMFTQVGSYPSGQPGIVHADNSGNLTSSLIVDSDVSSTAAIAQSKLGTTTIATWSAATAYQINDLVSYQGIAYRRKVAGTTATAPNADSTNWAQQTPTPTTTGGSNSLVAVDSSGYIRTSGSLLGPYSVESSGYIKIGTTNSALIQAGLSGGANTFTLPTTSGTLALADGSNFVSASTATSGKVLLSTSTASTSSTTAATSSAVKSAYDLANTANTTANTANTTANSATFGSQSGYIDVAPRYHITQPRSLGAVTAGTAAMFFTFFIAPSNASVSAIQILINTAMVGGTNNSQWGIFQPINATSGLYAPPINSTWDTMKLVSTTGYLTLTPALTTLTTQPENQLLASPFTLTAGQYFAVGIYYNTLTAATTAPILASIGGQTANQNLYPPLWATATGVTSALTLTTGNTFTVNQTGNINSSPWSRLITP